PPRDFRDRQHIGERDVAEHSKRVVFCQPRADRRGTGHATKESRELSCSGKRGMTFVDNGSDRRKFVVLDASRRLPLHRFCRHSAATIAMTARLREFLTEMSGEIPGQTSTSGSKSEHLFQPVEIRLLTILEDLAEPR